MHKIVISSEYQVGGGRWEGRDSNLGQTKVKQAVGFLEKFPSLPPLPQHSWQLSLTGRESWSYGT